jgi:hypothetical protein
MDIRSAAYTCRLNRAGPPRVFVPAGRIQTEKQNAKARPQGYSQYPREGQGKAFFFYKNALNSNLDREVCQTLFDPV